MSVFKKNKKLNKKFKVRNSYMSSTAFGRMNTDPIEVAARITAGIATAGLSEFARKIFK